MCTGRVHPAQPAGDPVPIEVDVAILGAGGAGSTLLLALQEAFAGRPSPSIAVVDPVHRCGQDRTWCLWQDASTPSGPLVHRSWRRAQVVPRRGPALTLDLGALQYVMLRSADVYAAAGAAADALAARRVTSAVTSVRPRGGGVDVLTGQGLLRARWVFDSRPAAPARPARTALLQHFRGQVLTFDRPLVDPSTPLLMDFRTPQPSRGVSFGYVLPLAADRALVEYTEFSRHRLDDAGYRDRLSAYLSTLFGAAADRARVEESEDGAIPMTDAVHRTRAGPGWYRMGTAGGATRPSSGYTFATMQRQAAAVAQALLAGREPVPPTPWAARHRWMDAVLLRVLDTPGARGADLFADLFARQGAERVLRFLDGVTSPAEELALMASAPARTMAVAAVQDAAARLANRIPGGGRPRRIA